MRFNILCGVLLFKVAATAITQPPINQVALVGESVTFTCRSNISPIDIWWQYYAPSNNKPELVSKNNAITDRFLSRFSVLNGDNRRHLQITDVQLNDVGLYVCSEEGYNRSAAQLRVLNQRNVRRLFNSPADTASDAADRCRFGTRIGPHHRLHCSRISHSFDNENTVDDRPAFNTTLTCSFTVQFSQFPVCLEKDRERRVSCATNSQEFNDTCLVLSIRDAVPYDITSSSDEVLSPVAKDDVTTFQSVDRTTQFLKDNMMVLVLIVVVVSMSLVVIIGIVAAVICTRCHQLQSISKLSATDPALGAAPGDAYEGMQAPYYEEISVPTEYSPLGGTVRVTTETQTTTNDYLAAIELDLLADTK